MTLIIVERDVMEQVVAVMIQVAFLNVADVMIVALMICHYNLFNLKKGKEVIMYTTDYCVGELATVRIGDDMTNLPNIHADCPNEGSGDVDCGCDAVDGS